MLKRLFLGIAISAVCVYLAFRKVDFGSMLEALRAANYWWLLPAVLLTLLSLWLRAVRWRYFMEPIKRVSTSKLFSAMVIGFMANNLFPLRLGEFLRAYAIGKSAGVSKVSSFATIIVEHIFDLLTVLAIVGLTIFYHSFPAWIEKGAWLIFILSVGFVVFIVFLLERTEQTLRLVESVLRPLPASLSAKAQTMLSSFLEGFVVFKRAEHYWAIAWQSVLVWLSYGAIVYVVLIAFRLDSAYDLPWVTSLVVLVMGSIGVMIPSSPGYVGTYHLLIIQGLVFFGVPASEAAGFAVVLHMVNFVPVTLVGLLYLWRENLTIHDAVTEKEIVRHAQAEPVG